MKDEPIGTLELMTILSKHKQTYDSTFASSWYLAVLLHKLNLGVTL